jgi:LPXTG-motif cell wall-anchored protein
LLRVTQDGPLDEGVRVNLRAPFRRTAAVVAGAVIGLAGAIAVLAPASAGEPTPSAEVTATSSCHGGGWKATFRLTTTDTNGADAIFSNFAYAYNGSAYGDHALPPDPLKLFVQDGKASGDGVFTEDWSLSRYFGGVGMTFTVTWHDGEVLHTKNVSARVDAPNGCDWPPPPVKPSPTASASNSPAAQPSTSASGTPTPALGENTTGSGGGLPVTGAAAGTLAGVAALLLAAGVVLFVMSRRRKVKFTA